MACTRIYFPRRLSCLNFYACSFFFFRIYVFAERKFSVHAKRRGVNRYIFPISLPRLAFILLIFSFSVRMPFTIPSKLFLLAYMTRPRRSFPANLLTIFPLRQSQSEGEIPLSLLEGAYFLKIAMGADGGKGESRKGRACEGGEDAGRRGGKERQE